jgi:cytosine/uracil/thiamine/allantoin permease
MWKYIVAFVAFAGLALWLLTKAGGDIDMGGERHEVPAATHADEKAPKK